MNVLIIGKNSYIGSNIRDRLIAADHYVVEFDAQNEAALLDMMRTLSADTERVKAMGEVAYARTKEFYDRPIMLNNLREDYEEILL